MMHLAFPEDAISLGFTEGQRMQIGFGLGITSQATLQVAPFHPSTIFADGRPGAFWQAAPFAAFADDPPTDPADLAEGVRVLTASPAGRPSLVQGTIAARPVFKREPRGVGVVNLVRQTEELDASPWLSGTVTITPNAGVNPFGRETADLISDTGAGSDNLYQAAAVTPGETYVFSFYLQPGTKSTTRVAFFNETAGSFITTNATQSSEAGPNGSTRIWATATAPAGCTSIRYYPLRATGVAGTVFLSCAQFELGTTPSAYQRVTTPFDVTQSGIPPLYAMASDASGKWMETPTNIDLSGASGVAMIWAGRPVGNNVRFAGHGSGTGFVGIRTGGAGALIAEVFDGSAKALSAAWAGEPAVVTLISHGGDLILRVNGVEAASRADIVPMAYQNAPLAVGSNPSPATTGRGAYDFAAALLMAYTPADLPAVQRAEQYLMTQLGIS
jgi:hypothetical protein